FFFRKHFRISNFKDYRPRYWIRSCIRQYHNDYRWKRLHNASNRSPDQTLPPVWEGANCWTVWAGGFQVCRAMHSSTATDCRPVE
ncbi:hypothetical protein AHF37_09975, partial [Paragonimus kellicotti]